MTAADYRTLADAALADGSPVAKRLRTGRAVDLRHGSGKARHSLGIVLRPSLSADGGIALAVEYLDGMTTGNTVTASASPERIECQRCAAPPAYLRPLDLLRIVLRSYGFPGGERRDGRDYWGLTDSPGR